MKAAKAIAFVFSILSANLMGTSTSLAQSDCREDRAKDPAEGQVTVFARELRAVAQATLPSCIDLRNTEMSPGVRCRTSRGQVMTRVEKPAPGWRAGENPGALIWVDGARFGVTRDEAAQFCAKRGLRLPTGAEFGELQSSFERAVIPPGDSLSRYGRREYFNLFDYTTEKLDHLLPLSSYFWSGDPADRSGKVVQHGGPAIALYIEPVDKVSPVARLNSGARCVTK